MPTIARFRAQLAAALDGGSVADQVVAVLRARRAAGPPGDDPAGLPVSAADRALLVLHDELLGRPLEHTVVCPRCGEPTTLPLGPSDVGPPPPHAAEDRSAAVREPTYGDVIAADGDAEALLARCRLRPTATFEDLMEAEGSLCGPLRSSCFTCQEPLLLDVDVAELVLRALSVLRDEFDREVHLLAAGYGWDLPTIEALPDERRSRLAGFLVGTSS